MKKIGLVVPVFAHRDLIIPFLKQFGTVDKIVVMSQKEALPRYVAECDCPTERDDTEELIRTMMEKDNRISLYRGESMGNYSSQVINESLVFLRDCDVVLRMDVDYFFTKKDIADLLNLIQTTNFDAYRIDFSEKTVINYYVTGSFEYGALDSRNGGHGQGQLLAFNPVKDLIWEHLYDTENFCWINELLPEFKIHHFRGWKPKFTKEFMEKEFNKDYEFLKAPQEIINLLTC